MQRLSMEAEPVHEEEDSGKKRAHPLAIEGVEHPNTRGRREQRREFLGRTQP